MDEPGPSRSTLWRRDHRRRKRDAKLRRCCPHHQIPQSSCSGTPQQCGLPNRPSSQYSSSDCEGPSASSGEESEQPVDHLGRSGGNSADEGGPDAAVAVTHSDDGDEDESDDDNDDGSMDGGNHYDDDDDDAVPFDEDDSDDDSDSHHGGGPHSGGSPDDDGDPDDGGYSGSEGDPDDPGEPGDEDDGPQEDNDSDGNEAGPAFSFHHRSLNVVCRSLHNRTAREALALLLAVAVRDSLTYECLIRTMKVFNGIFGRNYLPVHKKQLWMCLGRNDIGISKYAYCSSCLAGHGRLVNMPPEINCACGKRLQRKNVKYFIVLNVKKQLSQLLALPIIRNSLSYREERQVRIEGTMEDILDGSEYRLMQAGNNILASPYNYSYTFNLDGFRLTKSSRLEAWPIYLRVNELPWRLRNKHMLLAAVWVDQKHPNMDLLLDRFVTQANELSGDGVTWQPDGGNDVDSKFIPTCCIVDAQARCAVLNLNSPTGYSACPCCTLVGLHVGGCVHFPYLPPVPIPQRRTDQSIKASMLEAFNNHRVTQGFKGPSRLMNMEHLDLGKAIVTDDIHPFAGVIEDHLEILMTRTREYRPPYYIGDEITIARINERLLSIRTPTHISRKPRPLGTKNQWKSSEWRNWILYYAVPCLDGILPNRYLAHLELLSQAIFLVSRDIISPEDCDAADLLFHDFVRQYEILFGREKMTYNVHILLHVTDCVKEWGPIFVQSTSIFEWWNHKLMKTVTSPKAPSDQIVTRFLIHRFMDHIEENADVSDEVKAQVNVILNGGRLQNIIRVGNVALLGKGTRRMPSDIESNLMRERNIVCDELTEYARAVVDAGEFRCAAYRYGGEEVRSDNSHVLTWNDEFGQISTIVLVTHQNIRRVFVLLTILNTNVHRNRYICRVAAGADVHILATMEDIRCHAVFCNTATGPFIMPLANRSEID